MVYRIFDKKTGSRLKPNLDWLYERFKDNIWAAELAEMNRGVKYLLSVIDVLTKYTWVKPLNDNRSKTVLHGFIEIVIRL